MDEKDKVGFYVEMWKQSIDVQKHFNDIELRVRSLALTLLTFALGGATLAVKEGRVTTILGMHLQLGSIVLVAGLISWLAFYFMDQVWYHRLLVGAVKHAEDIEDILRGEFPGIALTHTISANSPYSFRVGLGRLGRDFSIHSASKIRLFYLIVALLLVVLALVVQFGSASPEK